MSFLHLDLVGSREEGIQRRETKGSQPREKPRAQALPGRRQNEWGMHFSEQGEGRSVKVNKGHSECCVLGRLTLTAPGPTSIYKEKTGSASGG